MTVFYQKLNQLCKDAKITVKHLITAELGLSGGMGTAWKTGRSEPSSEDRARIATFFGVDEIYLVDDSQQVKIGLGLGAYNKNQKNGRVDVQVKRSLMITTKTFENMRHIWVAFLQKMQENKIDKSTLMNRFDVDEQFWERIGRGVAEIEDMPLFMEMALYVGIDDFKLLISDPVKCPVIVIKDVDGNIIHRKPFYGFDSLVDDEGFRAPSRYTSDVYKHWAWLPIYNKITEGAATAEQLMQELDMDENFLNMLCMGVVLDTHKYFKILERLNLLSVDFDKTQSRLIIVGSNGNEKIMSATEFFALNNKMNSISTDKTTQPIVASGQIAVTGTIDAAALFAELVETRRALVEELTSHRAELERQQHITLEMLNANARLSERASNQFSVFGGLENQNIA